MLDWALPLLNPNDIAFLGTVADDAVAALRPALVGSDEQLAFYRRILESRVIGPLAKRGVHLSAAAQLSTLLSPPS